MHGVQTGENDLFSDLPTNERTRNIDLVFMHRFPNFHVSNAFVYVLEKFAIKRHLCAKNNPVEKPGIYYTTQTNRKNGSETAKSDKKRQKPAACLLVNHKNRRIINRPPLKRNAPVEMRFVISI